jgi:NADH-quinone oxidoreductase subunit C
MQNFFDDFKLHFKESLDIQQAHFTEFLGEHTLIISVQHFLDVMHYLKHSAKFLQLTDMTAVDYPHRTERFEIVYQLLNLHRNVRLRVKVSIGESGAIPSLCRVYKSANWYEREVFDMFGVVFDQHPNLIRILTDYTFDAYPLRKDFPTEGNLEVHYDEDAQRVVYDVIDLPQENRQFDFVQNKWNTPKYQPNPKSGDNHDA